jgi:hypothetical protein
VLGTIRPHLVVKLRQAEIAIEYQLLPSEEKVARGEEYRDHLMWHNSRQTHRRMIGAGSEADVDGCPWCGARLPDSLRDDEPE